ncbi:hypothetical protein [Sediminibacillus massiliensis]|uniref:hypothetical protein n=1 Tax=Sediminibacillus massiliensis TaxID=1926277 RepID=UPI000988362A|nr:hypothetical protein [Sediminibacillus massiliensis]
MKYLKFAVYHFILFIPGLIVVTFLDENTGPPFDYYDAVYGIISVTIYVFAGIVINKLYKQFTSITPGIKILVSLMAFIAAVVCLGLIESIWFEITGEMLF